jgi:hypothetical protein
MLTDFIVTNICSIEEQTNFIYNKSHMFIKQLRNNSKLSMGKANTIELQWHT